MFSSCSKLSFSLSEPMFSGFGGVLTGIAIVIVVLFAFMTLFFVPVSGPILDTERFNGRFGKATFLPITFLIIGLLILSLGLLFFPADCVRNAYLVSAWQPPEASQWSVEVEEFKRDLSVEAQREEFNWINLAPMRDDLLRSLERDGLMNIPDDIGILSERIQNVMMSYPVPLVSSSQAVDVSQFSPALIESVEVGILMAWRARYYTNDQKISYMVTDRASRYGWDWPFIAGIYFTDSKAERQIAQIREFTLQTQRPFLDQVITSTKDNDSLTAVAVFVPNQGGMVEIVLVNGSGASAKDGKGVLGSTVLSLPSANPGERLIRTLTFSLDKSAVGSPQKLVQIKPFRTERILPSSMPEILNVYVAADRPEDMTLATNSLKMLSKKINNCSIPDLTEYHFWVDRVGQFIRPDKINIVDDISIAHVAYYLRKDGAAWVLPAEPISSVNSEFKDLKLDATSAISIGSPQLVLSAIHSSDLTIFVEQNAFDPFFTLNLLALPNNNMLRVVNSQLISGEEKLAASPQSRDMLGSLPLGVNEFSNDLLHALKVGVKLADPQDVEHSWEATFFAPDTKEGGFYCGLRNMAEAETFYGYWYGVFRDFRSTALPSVGAFEGGFLGSDGTPQIVMNHERLVTLSNKRFYFGVILLYSIFFVYFCLRTFLFSLDMQRPK